MRAGKLLLQFAIMLAVITAFNSLIGAASKKTIASQVLTKCRTAENPTDVFLGNSLMDAGFDAVAFQREIPSARPLNGACGSTGPISHFLIFDQIPALSGKRIHYGFYDTQLTDKLAFNLQDFTGNNTIIFKVDLSGVTGLLGPWEKAAARAFSLVPVYYERMAIWAKVEKLRRVLASIGGGMKSTNRFGNAEDFQLLEPESAEKLDQYLNETTRKREGLSPPILEIIKKAVENRDKVYFILMPMPKAHRARFNSSKAWDSYLSQLKKQIEDSGCHLVNALDWIGDEGFEDHLHLNPAGAGEFMRKYAGYLEKPK